MSKISSKKKKKKWCYLGIEFTVLSSLCGSCPALWPTRNMHFPIHIHISMPQTRNTLLPSPTSQHQCVWEGSSDTLSQISNWKPWWPGLRAEPRHPLAPQSEGGPVPLHILQNCSINTKESWFFHERQRAIFFCKLNLKKDIGITVIFKLFFCCQHLCLLACLPAPKDQHPKHCHHLIFYSMAKSTTCFRRINCRLTQEGNSK